MLTMDEAAAHVDRRTHESLDSQCIKPYRGPHRVDDRIHGADLMKLHILRRDMMDVPFRNRELGKDRLCDALGIGIQGARTDHGQDLRRLAMKMRMGMGMVCVMIMMMVSVLIAHDHIELHRT